MIQTLRKWDFLDFAKVAGIMLVIMFHAAVEANSIHAYGYNSFWGILGAFAVSIFLMASGFGLALNKSTMPVGEFYKTRLVKLFPPYWVAYAAVALFLFVVSARPLLPMQLDDILFSVIGMDGQSMGWLSHHSGGHLVGDWFFGMLIILYMLFPFLNKLVRRAPLATFVVASIILCLGWHYNDWLYNNLLVWNRSVHMSLSTSMLPFISGMILAKFIQNRRVMLWLSIVSVGVLVVDLFVCRTLILDRFAYMAVFVLVAFTYDRIRFPGIWKRSVDFLSKYSFMAFLLQHQLILIWLRAHTETIPSFANSHFLVCYLIGMVILSFGGAMILQPAADKLRKLLFK